MSGGSRRSPGQLLTRLTPCGMPFPNRQLCWKRALLERHPSSSLLAPLPANLPLFLHFKSLFHAFRSVLTPYTSANKWPRPCKRSKNARRPSKRLPRTRARPQSARDRAPRARARAGARQSHPLREATGTTIASQGRRVVSRVFQCAPPPLFPCRAMI